MAIVAEEFTARQQAALERVDELITHAHGRARTAGRWYYALQSAAIVLAAITPCLILIAQGNSGFLQWVSAFAPAFAAVSAGLSHVFDWRQESVRCTTLEESIRSERWRYMTRTGDYGPTLTNDQALDHLVTRVDQINVHAVAEWSAEQLATSAPASSAASSGATPSPDAHA